MNWISVADALPPPRTTVVLAVVNEWSRTVCLGWIEDEYGAAKERWREATSGYFDQCRKISPDESPTHWADFRPLPTGQGGSNG